MDSLFASSLLDLNELELHAQAAAVTGFGGRSCLRLENGLALLPFSAEDCSLEVWIAAEGACYAGLTWRAAGAAASGGYELAYAQPHTSGGWDAIQYDPVFNNSNTWQVFHGPPYQRSADVPTGRWFRLKVDVCGTRAAIGVDEQPPLVVERLAYAPRLGQLGLWTYLPAFFAGLKVHPCTRIEARGVEAVAPPGTLLEWELEGVGPLHCEPNGILNLNRCLPTVHGEARLSHRFNLDQAASLELGFGFSDRLALALDGRTLFEGENLFHGMQPDYAQRGYILPNQHTLRVDLAGGEHVLSAVVQVTEGFGWGLTVQMSPAIVSS